MGFGIQGAMRIITITCVLAAATLYVPTYAETNVLGTELKSCGPNDPDGCTYSPLDAGAHEVCTTHLPNGFSAKTGQGPWSQPYTGKPWCICIWAYSNFILHNSVNKMPLRCNAIPDKVLEEKYSLDKFEQCGKMSSPMGCGVEDIRRSIQSLCKQCHAQAEDASQRDFLKAKCEKLLESAPHAMNGPGGGAPESQELTEVRHKLRGTDSVVPEKEWH